RTAGAMFSNLGESARFRGDHERAAELYQKALNVAREIGDRPSEMIYLSNLSGARLGLRQFRDAEADLRQVLALTSSPKTCNLSETYSFLAEACLGQNKIPEAMSAAAHALTLAQSSGNEFDLGGAWRALGEVGAALSESGREPAAATWPVSLPSDPAACFAESIRIFKKIAAKGEAARTLQAWSLFEQQQGRARESALKLGEAEAILRHLS